MNDVSFLAEFMVPVIVGICLCVGYVVKKWIKDVDNKYIPTICAVLGVFLAIWINGWTITASILLSGLFSGLASTGLHQLFKQYIEKGKFDGFNLDGGMARNTYIDPLIEDNVDKVLIISTRHNFELPQKVMQKIDSNKVIIISPKAEIDNKDLLNFSPEFCSKLYKEGYEMGLEFDLNLLQI